MTWTLTGTYPSQRSALEIIKNITKSRVVEKEEEKDSTSSTFWKDKKVMWVAEEMVLTVQMSSDSLGCYEAIGRAK